MSTLLGLFLDPFDTDPAEADEWIVLRLVVRSLGALWLGAALLVAVLYRFVALLAQDVEPTTNDR